MRRDTFVVSHLPYVFVLFGLLPCRTCSRPTGFSPSSTISRCSCKPTTCRRVSQRSVLRPRPSDQNNALLRYRTHLASRLNPNHRTSYPSGHHRIQACSLRHSDIVRSRLASRQSNLQAAQPPDQRHSDCWQAQPTRANARLAIGPDILVVLANWPYVLLPTDGRSVVMAECRVTRFRDTAIFSLSRSHRKAPPPTRPSPSEVPAATTSARSWRVTCPVCRHPFVVFRAITGAGLTASRADCPSSVEFAVSGQGRFGDSQGPWRQA